MGNRGAVLQGKGRFQMEKTGGKEEIVRIGKDGFTETYTLW
ncbi:hypothetical protein VSQ48_21260 [Candidatus Ventrimonas sp. KK005]